MRTRIALIARISSGSRRLRRASNDALSWPVGLLHRHLDRAQHALRLGLGLGELVLGLGVGHRAAAGLDVGDAVLDDDRADVDAGVEVAGVAEVADRATVSAALDRLELVDDLHRAD